MRTPDGHTDDLDPHGRPWATDEEIDATVPPTVWNPPMRSAGQCSACGGAGRDCVCGDVFDNF